MKVVPLPPPPRCFTPPSAQLGQSQFQGVKPTMLTPVFIFSCALAACIDSAPGEFTPFTYKTLCCETGRGSLNHQKDTKQGVGQG